MKHFKKFELKISRFTVIQVVFLLMLCILLKRLYQLQIIDGKKYAQNVQRKITRTLKTKAARGTIYDCKGRVLASDQMIYTITMMDSEEYKTNRERQLTLNSMIYRLLRKLEENGEKINNEIKIGLDKNGRYVYTVEGRALERLKADIFGEADPKNLSKEQLETDAEQMMEYLAGNEKFALYGEGSRAYTKEELQTYGLKEKYTKEWELKIIGIRYMLSLNAYHKYQSITIAKNISEKTLAYVLENKERFLGINIEEDWERVYEGGEAAAHILGYTGKVSSEELEELQKKSEKYSTDSIVGKAGIEQYLEEKLQGTEGEREVIVNNVGRIIGEGKTIKETSAGKDVMLTIDKELQTKVYHILEKNIAEIVYSHLINKKEFSKETVRDTTEIQIPVYDVYRALVENNIVHLQQMTAPEASKLEKDIVKKQEEKENEVLKKVTKELKQGSTPYKKLSKEMKAYMDFIVSESGILEKEKIDTEDSVSVSWKEKGEMSVKEFLLSAIEKDWINHSIMEEGQAGDMQKEADNIMQNGTDNTPQKESDNNTQEQQVYYTKEELYSLLIQKACQCLKEDTDMKKTMFYYLLLEDKISGKDICELLYEQNVLEKDADYEHLKNGQMTPFSFIKKKIKNLEITPAQLALDPCSGSAVVLDTDTGKVLACVTYPGYDNNRLANEIDHTYYSQLLLDQSLPFYNRATQQMTAPGSTLKPITIIAGLQEAVISPHTSVFCDGVFDEVRPNLRCWKHSGHGEVPNPATAIQSSCNDYLCEISYRLGKKGSDKYDDNQALFYLKKYAKLFDLDKKSGIEMVESSPHITDNYGIPSAIGQGTHNYTTVQIARYINTLATKGNSFSLSLIKGIEDKNGKIKEQDSVLQSKVELPESTWNTVKKGMIQFAQNNTTLKEMPIKIAGKTGTAQEVQNRPDHALFAGYAPADKPEISVVVRIANGYSSANAVYVGEDIFRYYFKEN